MKRWLAGVWRENTALFVGASRTVVISLDYQRYYLPGPDRLFHEL